MDLVVCKFINVCGTNFSISFWYKNHNVLPSCVCSSLAGTEIEKKTTKLQEHSPVVRIDVFINVVLIYAYTDDFKIFTVYVQDTNKFK